MGFSYPLLAAFSFSKGKFAYLKRSYSRQNVKEFVSNITSGREVLEDLPKNIPLLKKVDILEAKKAEFDEKDEF